MQRPYSPLVPATLQMWRKENRPSMKPWEVLREWFATQGLLLYKEKYLGAGITFPPVENSVRGCDGFVYASPSKPPYIHRMHEDDVPFLFRH